MAMNGTGMTYLGSPPGVRFDNGTYIAPPGKRIVFLRSTGRIDGDPPELSGRIHTTLDAAASHCRSGAGDIILALRGHVEDIASADQISSLVAGTTIIGEGTGTDRPTFTWTTATSTFLLDVANVTISNCILNMDPGTGTVNVAAPITVSAAGCGLYGCKVRMGTDANSKVTNGITTTAAADDFTLSDNHVYGATAATCTSMLKFVGADRLTMVSNVIEGATASAAAGVVLFATTASLNMRLSDNVYINRKALSTAAVTGLAACSGVSKDEHFAYLDTSSLTPWLTSTGIMTFANPRVTNTAGETGSAVVGTVSA